MSLHIGTTTCGTKFSLPIDLVTQSIAILAKRGVGKTYTAAVFAEQLLEAKQVPVIIDPTGAHWGLKCSANGKSAGYPVYVFGGEHADLPLEETSGEIIARAIVEHRFPAVIDLKLLRKGQSTRFLGAFFEALYRLNREPLHLICDEADYYAPQKPFREETRTLGAMEDIVRRGRINGLGCTMITQRPAVLNKNVLTQCEMLVAMRLVHPKDIDAIHDWVEVHGDSATASKMISDLPSLPIGTAWIWSPGWGDIFERVKIAQRTTFDSSATPKPGQRVIAPQSFAHVDVEKLGKEIAATADRAKADDPRALKAKIASLQAELMKKPSAIVERVEVPVLTEKEINLIRTGIIEVGSLRGMGKSIDEKIDLLWKQFNGLAGHIANVSHPDVKRSVPVPAKYRPVKTPINNEPTANLLSNGQRKILTVLAQYPAGKESTALAHLAGFTVNGHFNNMLGGLRAAGYANRGQPVIITDEGSAALGKFEPLPTGDALRQYWLGKVSTGERKILEVLFGIYPRTIRSTELAGEAGFTVNGHFNNMMGHLRTMELVARGPDIKASESIFG